LNNQFFNAMNGYSDEEYLELLCRAESEPVIDGIQMPGFTDSQFQVNTVGSSGVDSLRGEGFAFYKYIKAMAAKHGVTIGESTRILDFGCGWGRMIRFWFKDIKSENIFGIDVDSKMVDVCENTLPCGNFSVTAPAPPCEFADGSFDIIFAYSVFSHLSSDMAEKWIVEFKRLLKNGGILVATTRDATFIDVCENFRLNPELATKSDYSQMLSKCFAPAGEHHDKFKRGEYLFSPTGGGETRDSSFYGETMVPEKYVRDIWGKLLTFRQYESSGILPQAVFVLQNGEPSVNDDKKLSDLRFHMDRQTEQINLLRSSLTEAERRASAAKVQVDEMEHSRSWKLTKPYRWLGRLFRGG